MAYRRAYTRKDGTYVSDSWDRRKSRGNKNNNDNNSGCLTSVIFIIVAFIIIKCSK